MKCLSLWQPWASLVAQGAKRYETRSWAPPKAMRGDLFLIHAAKKRDAESLGLVACCGSRFAEALSITNEDELPFGALLSIHRLRAVHRTERIRDDLSTDEVEFGNYDDGRFAWELEYVARLDPPIPYKGHQGLFTVDVGQLGGRWIPPIDLVPPSRTELF